MDIGECCGDSLVVYFRDGRDRQVVNLVSSMRSALLSAGDVSITEEPTVWPSFYFWPYSPGGGVQRIIIAFSFESDALDLGEGGVINGFGGIHADYGFMVFELVETVRDDVTGVIPIPTQGGSMAVIGFRDLGTVSSDVSDHIWRIQYDTLSRQPSVNRLFVSGLTSFTEEATGIVYIVYSNRYQSEVVVITDPWAHPVTVEIVQRFGTPPILNLDSGDAVGYNYFGLSEDESRDWTPGSGMSNPYHTFYPVVGMHSITVVANTAGNQGQAKVYEFVFQPRTQSRLNGMKGPSVFKVPYIRTNVGISIPTMGGAKPVGEKLYFVATGTSKDFVGLMVIDKEGGVVQRCLSPDAAQSATGISDPFIFTYVYDDNLFTVENGSKFDRKMLVHK